MSTPAAKPNKPNKPNKQKVSELLFSHLISSDRPQWLELNTFLEIFPGNSPAVAVYFPSPNSLPSRWSATINDPL